MRWAAVTLALGAVLLALVSWVALRDHQGEGALAGQRTTAMRHARALLRVREGSGPCASCRADVVGPLREHLWRVSLQIHGSIRCFDVDNDRFVLRADGAATGVRPTPCPTR